MKKAKYYRIEIKLITQEIIEKYYLIKKQSDGYIYVRVKKSECMAWCKKGSYHMNHSSNT